MFLFGHNLFQGHQGSGGGWAREVGLEGLGYRHVGK